MPRRLPRPSRLLAGAIVTAALAASVASPCGAQVSFEDATAAAGIDDPVDVQGVSFADADDDGDPDLYLTLVLSALLGQGNQLYINNGPDGGGGWSFSEEAVARGVSDDETSYGPGWGDLDNDGDQDLLVANGANAILPNAVHLYVNDGYGMFRNEAALRGLDAPQSGRSVTWADYDNDGDVDIFLTTPDLVFFGERYYLFRNDSGRFTDVTAAVGLSLDALNTDAAAWADYDGDGDQDLYVVNHGVAPLTEANELWKNLLTETGTATFTNVAAVAGVADEASSTGAAWGDCDNDGDLDLYVATGVDIFSIFGINAPNRLYRNEGDGTFTDVAGSAGVNGTDVTVREQVSFSAAWSDFDDDGWLDVYVTNSRLELSPTTPSNVMLRNVGNCRFEEVDIGVNDSGSGQGTALGDFDGDGWVDIFVANLLSGGSQTARLYRNATGASFPSRHWMAIDTIGVDSNRDGIGALVKAFVGAQVLTRHVYAGSGYLSQDSLEVEFGLGDATAVDRLEIHWPSGCVQVVDDPAIDRLLKIVEDCIPGFDSASVSDQPCGTGLLVDWQPATFPSGAGHYEIRRGATCLAAEASAELLPRPLAPPFLDATSLAGETWAYALLAIDDVNGTTARLCAGSATDVDGSGFTATPLAAPNPACPLNPVQLAATGPLGATFEWDADGDGAFELSGTPVTTSWPAAGTYRVDLRTTSGGCSRIDSLDVEVRSDIAPVIDPASLRLRRPGPEDPELTWTLISGTGTHVVRRSLSRFDWAAGPGGVAVVATPDVPTWVDVGLDLQPGEVGYYQVFPGDCR